MGTARVLCITDQNDTLNSVRPEAEMMIGARRLGVHVDVMTQTDSVYADQMRAAGMTVHDYPIRKKFDSAAVRIIRNLLDSNGYNVLHLFNNKAIVCGLRASRGRKVRVLTYRGQTGNTSRWDPSCYLTHLHPRVAKITCVADSVKDDLARHLWQPSKAVRIYKGHDLSWYTDKPADLSEFGLRDSDFVVCAVANIRPRKGLTYLIDSARYLPADAPIKYLLVGAGLDTPQVTDAIARFPGRFVLAGFRRDAPALVAASNVSVLASTKREGLPKTVIESMVYGVTPIVTRTGGSPELVENNVSGLVIEPADSKAIASAIITLWKAPQRNAQMGQRARERIATHFNVAQSAEQLAALYKEQAEYAG